MITASGEQRTVQILLVEDNPGDVELISDTFASCATPSHLTVASTGERALEFLADREPSSPPVDLVVLDLNLPGISGHDVLIALRANPGVGNVPVVVFSSSTRREDITASYAEHANSYVTKPTRLEEFVAAIAGIEGYWLGTAELP